MKKSPYPLEACTSAPRGLLPFAIARFCWDNLLVPYYACFQKYYVCFNFGFSSSFRFALIFWLQPNHRSLTHHANIPIKDEYILSSNMRGTKTRIKTKKSKTERQEEKTGAEIKQKPSAQEVSLGQESIAHHNRGAYLENIRPCHISRGEKNCCANV